MKTNEIIMNMVIQNNGNWAKTYHQLQNKEYCVEGCLDDEGKFLTILDQEYPDYLKQKRMPSFAFAYEGNLDLLKSPTRIGVSAIKEDKNFNIFNRNINANKNNLVLVIGSNNTIEREIINNGYKVICVLDKPINELEPQLRQNIINNGGLIITEFVSHQCEKEDELRVLQLITHIQSELLVVSIMSHSKGIYQVNQALEQSQRVLVFPTGMNNKLFNNELINEGANIFVNADQF